MTTEQQELQRRRFAIAAWIVGWALFFLSAAVVCDAVGQIKGTYRFHPPDYFVDLVKLAITSGLIVLGLPMLPKKK